MRWDYYNKKYESMDGWGHPLTFENDEIQKLVFFSFSHKFQSKKSKILWAIVRSSRYTWVLHLCYTSSSSVCAGCQMRSAFVRPLL